MNRNAVVAIVAVIALVAVGVVAWNLRGDDSDQNGDGPAFAVAAVERRDLSDTVTVRGEVRRDEIQRITSGVDGQVSSVLVEDGDTIDAGDVIYGLDGRAAVAVNGEFSFFRQLDVGSDGPDVEQLERILADEGYQVGIVDQLFTEETRAGLRQWQIDRGYGGATPEPDEFITVSLQNNPAGYSVGARNSVSVQLGPSVPDSNVVIEGSGRDTDEGTADGPSSFRAPAQDPEPEPPASPPVPSIEVTVAPATVLEGETATFTFTSDIPMPSDTVIDYQVGGDATAGDDFDDDGLSGTFVFPGGTSSFDLAVETLTDDELDDAETVTITVGTAIITNENENYRPGPLKEATLTISSPAGEPVAVNVTANQQLVNEGGAASFVFEADRVSNEATTLFFTLGGSARSGSDYTTPDLEIDLPAGAESVTLTIATIDDSLVEGDETLSVALDTTKGTGTYEADTPSSASTVIESDDVPELTITGGGAIAEGDNAGFTIHADQAVSVDTSVNYAVGGSATPGRDYQELSGTAIIPAGQNHVHVGIASLDDDVIFRPGDMVVAQWPARIGTVSVDEGEFILLGQEVLTLTEPDFTITLLLSPTDRGQLDVTQVVTVELQASDQEVQGFIAELDETATIDPAGGEVYEGVIETVDPLDAVDGASVNVEVVLEERLDVIVVPVASVLQDGEGNDVVRVVLEDRTTRQVQVTTGLSEGSYIEIESGLDGDEIVLVDA